MWPEECWEEEHANAEVAPYDCFSLKASRHGCADILTERSALRHLLAGGCCELSRENEGFFATVPFSHNTPRSDFMEESQAMRYI